MKTKKPKPWAVGQKFWVAAIKGGPFDGYDEDHPTGIKIGNTGVVVSVDKDLVCGKLDKDGSPAYWHPKRDFKYVKRKGD